VLADDQVDHAPGDGRRTVGEPPVEASGEGDADGDLHAVAPTVVRQPTEQRAVRVVHRVVITLQLEGP
jgi:hypothetical protein